MIITEFSQIHSLKMKLCFFKAVSFTVNPNYVLKFYTMCSAFIISYSLWLKITQMHQSAFKTPEGKCI